MVGGGGQGPSSRPPPQSTIYCSDLSTDTVMCMHTFLCEATGVPLPVFLLPLRDIHGPPQETWLHHLLCPGAQN